MPKKVTLRPETIIESRQLASLGKVLNTLAALLVTIIGIRFIAHDLIAPILLALFFVVLTYPVFKWFRNKGLSSGISLLLMIVTFVASVSVLVAFLSWSFGLIHESLATSLAAFKASFTQITGPLNLGGPAEAITQNLSPDTVGAFLSNVLSRFSSLVYYFVFVPILSFLILIQIDSLPQNFSRQLLQENPGLRRLQKFAQSITLYVTGRFKVNLMTGLLFTISLIIFGIDYPVVWGLLTVILSFIPYIGLVIAGIPPVVLAFASGQAGLALLVVIGLVVINLIAENILEPFIQSRSHKISTATVVIALIFWSWLLGFIGALLAVPLTVLLKTVLSDYSETRWLAALMEGNYRTLPHSPKT